jgi:hypothetical protein
MQQVTACHTFLPLTAFWEEAVCLRTSLGLPSRPEPPAARWEPNENTDNSRKAAHMVTFAI